MRVLAGGAAGLGVACALDHSVTLAWQGSGSVPKPEPTPKRAIIRTLLRDYSPDGLGNGAILFHEHMSYNNEFLHKFVVEARGGDAPPMPTQPYFMEDIDYMVEEVRSAAQDGVSCLVDGGHADMGSSNTFLKQLSEKSGVPIVGSGGYYRQLTYPSKISQMSEDELVEEFVQGAAVKRWGAFGEIGSSNEMTLDEHKMFRAIGKAHLRTGLPIFTHTQNGKCALAQLDIFETVGVKPQNVVIGHTCCYFDPNPWRELHRTIAERGAYIGFDRVGGEMKGMDVPRVKMVLALLEAGYVKQALFASDLTSKSSSKQAGGGGLARAVTKFGTMLKEAGVDDKTLQTILVENPRRFLAFVPKA